MAFLLVLTQSRGKARINPKTSTLYSQGPLATGSRS
jgi:hypothetical protein